MTNQREIKFKLIENNKVVGYEIWHKEAWIYYTHNGKRLLTLEAFIPHDHKLQFTGLKDRNGVEIYEGDITSFLWGEQQEAESFFKQKAVVLLSRGGFLICNRNAQDATFDNDGSIKNFMWLSKGHYTMPDFYNEIKNVEVIGNIYENPELKLK